MGVGVVVVRSAACKPKKAKQDKIKYKSFLKDVPSSQALDSVVLRKPACYY